MARAMALYSGYRLMKKVSLLWMMKLSPWNKERPEVLKLHYVFSHWWPLVAGGAATVLDNAQNTVVVGWDFCPLYSSGIMESSPLSK
jgi:hypothetical protein